MTERDQEHDEVDEASEESFPASDPPAWEPSHAGAPRVEPATPATGDSASPEGAGGRES